MKVFGIKNCPYCEKQKDEIKKGDNIEYINCSDSSNFNVCKRFNAFPTWQVNSAGKTIYLEGYRNVEMMKKKYL